MTDALPSIAMSKAEFGNSCGGDWYDNATERWRDIRTGRFTAHEWNKHSHPTPEDMQLGSVTMHALNIFRVTQFPDGSTVRVPVKGFGPGPMGEPAP